MKVVPSDSHVYDPPLRAVHRRAAMIATLHQLARALRCRPDQAEDVVRDETSARALLSRRGLLAGAGAVAAGKAFGFPVPHDPSAALLALFEEIGRVNERIMRNAQVPFWGMPSPHDYIFRDGDEVTGS
jgi:hypothetical protein